MPAPGKPRLPVTWLPGISWWSSHTLLMVPQKCEALNSRMWLCNWTGIECPSVPRPIFPALHFLATFELLAWIVAGLFFVTVCFRETITTL